MEKELRPGLGGGRGLQRGWGLQEEGGSRGPTVTADSDEGGGSAAFGACLLFTGESKILQK